jgi:bla regulator protein blaR1
MTRTVTSFLTVLAMAAMALGQTACTTATQHEDRPATVDFASCGKPVYPPASLAAGNEGTVTVSMLVKTDGSVGDAKVLKSSGFVALDDAARDGIRLCKFHPAVRGGKAAQEWTPVQYVWVSKK